MYGEEFGIKYLELVAFKEHIQDDIIWVATDSIQNK